MGGEDGRSEDEQGRTPRAGGNAEGYYRNAARAERETGKSMKAANDRVAELGAEMARLKKRAANQGTSAKPQTTLSARRIMAASAKPADATKTGLSRSSSRRLMGPDSAKRRGLSTAASEPLNEEAEAIKVILVEQRVIR